MEKDKLKTESHYNTIVKVNGTFESIDIVQEENINRNNIKISIFQDRWRTVADTIELLEKTIIVLKKNF